MQVPKEAELLVPNVPTAFVTFDGKPMGERITTAEAEDYIFGLVLFNDWSARDIQAWEYVPLGPFLGKNFATTVGDTVVPLADLEPFRISGPDQDPTPLPYLQRTGPSHFDITLEAWLETADGSRTLLTRTNHKHLYWDIRQQLVHHTSNGCPVRAGDILASGTISGPERSSWGCMLELSWNGTQPLTLKDGSQRKFLEDEDIIELRGWVGEAPAVYLGIIRNPVVPEM